MNSPSTVCPICGRKYDERPALSRKDNKTYICPACGMAEALDDARELPGRGMAGEQWEKYQKQIIAAVGEKK